MSEIETFYIITYKDGKQERISGGELCRRFDNRGKLIEDYRIENSRLKSQAKRLEQNIVTLERQNNNRIYNLSRNDLIREVENKNKEINCLKEKVKKQEKNHSDTLNRFVPKLLKTIEDEAIKKGHQVVGDELVGRVIRNFSKEMEKRRKE